eukprot:TRINITY_DN54332_c0_g2_i1.p1 TRINITY_DN54332_c0_g2~~TRINITY_DN54332_c0_g2_i1.p1  ORF type:complete len:171 (-),score=25.48 TRINITY_DN54332_c0_g2_i1:505-1017(-)
MFFHLTLERIIRVHPRDLDKNVRKHIIDRLNGAVEGTCSGTHGYIIAVTDVIDVGNGRVQDDGTTSYTIKFKAVVFKPFKDQVVDAVVTNLAKHGIFAEVGPLQVFISQHNLPAELTFNDHSIPKCWQAEDGTSIKKDDDVRLKILGTQITGSEMYAVGMMKEDYLGAIS